jgi:hypothetical protein
LNTAAAPAKTLTSRAFPSLARETYFCHEAFLGCYLAQLASQQEKVQHLALLIERQQFLFWPSFFQIELRAIQQDSFLRLAMQL